MNSSDLVYLIASPEVYSEILLAALAVVGAFFMMNDPRRRRRARARRPRFR